MSISNSRSGLLACTAIAVWLTANAASAQQAASSPDEGGTLLEQVVVKGKRLKGTAADTPLATQTDGKTIAEKQIQTLDDLGNTTEPGVSYVARSKSVNIRGLEDDRVLTTIDNVTIPHLADMVHDSYGGADSYDFTSLASVGILRGADSSRIGGGALGGAVVLRTWEP